MVPDARIPRPNRSPAATPHPQPRKGPLSARNLAASLWRLNPNASFDRLCFQFCSSFPAPNLEGATKWDFCDYVDEPFESRKHVNEVETRTKHRLRKVEVIKNMAEGVRAERRICNDIKKANSALLRDIADAKSSATKLLRDLQRERRAREELEGACYALAREIEARKAETSALREQQQRVRLEAEKERKMRQMAEVWREERAQMKLADANVILEDKYAEVNGLIAELKAFLASSDSHSNAGLNVTTKAEILREVFGLVMTKGGCKHAFPESNNAFADARTSEAGTRSGGDGEGSMNKGSHTSQKCLAKTKGSSMVMDGCSARRNPHIVRAMKGHIEWPRRGSGSQAGEPENGAEAQGLKA
ncbi:hypothetical protein AAHA92_29866 [Salvia divinorum]|uniref:Uncharacterized protein n=1 Tax=Salvia divinorum TaxID=28513 RepID=A0ABD1FZR7_SALDI